MIEHKKKIIIGSLQFSPIYKSHCCALGSLAEKNGFDVSYLFSSEYAWMLSDAVKVKTIFLGRTDDIKTAIIDGLNPRNYQRIRQVLQEEKPGFIYMYNFHPFFNKYLASLSKKNGCTYIQHIHEPHYENKKVYGGLMRYWLYLFESFQGNLLASTDVVIISSRISLQLFRERYPEYSGRIVTAPLLYEDLGSGIQGSEKPEYLTLVGPPVPAKGPEIFLRIAAYAEEHCPQMKFQIISRLPVRDPVYYRNRNVRVVYKNRISDEEMRDFMRQSIAVVTPYKAGTQSSVVITANMVGTPVLSSAAGGLPEFIRHQITGYLVDTNAPVEKWVEGIDYIIAHRDTMSPACRQNFAEGYSETSWQKFFNIIFNP